MTNPHHYKAFLRQISSNAAAHTAPTDHPLSTNQSIVIGRDTNCQIVLDSTNYPRVSSRHLEIRPIMPQPSGSPPSWEVCDLGSSNGTYVNHQRLQGCRTLQVGDRISLGQQGVEFVFECQVSTPGLPGRPSNIQFGDSFRLSQMLPIISTKQDLLQKGFLIPGIVTVVSVVAMFATKGSLNFFYVLAAYLSAAVYYIIYRLCGKAKPWWLLFGSALTTAAILLTPLGQVILLPFYTILPGSLFVKGNNFIDFAIGAFCGPGLGEELLKALPVLALYQLGRGLRSPQRERVGIWEPLDGILVGAASAVGFTLVETLVQYVPETIAKVARQDGEGVGYFVGLQLLIPRILANIFGHLAYSGYFGYFIGLSALKPSKRWQILAIGYFTAAALHGLWDLIAIIPGSIFTSSLLLALTGAIAYVFLMAAILKARQLSPNRSQNWATQYYSPPPLPQAPFFLQIGHKKILLTVGSRLQAREIPGLGAQSTNGVVAEVNVNPRQPSILGLQNCSHQIWIATLVNGQQKQIDPNRSIKLAAGIKINFGSVQGEVR